MTYPELDKAEPVDCYEQAVCDLAKATEEQRSEIARLSSELAASRERERALERYNRDLIALRDKDDAELKAAEAIAALGQVQPALALIEELTDEQLRHIAESKDVGTCRARIRTALASAKRFKGE